MAVRKEKRLRRKPKAATQDVLGALPQAERVPTKWRKHFNRLVQLREQFQRRRGTLNEDAREEQPFFSSHMADAATDTYDRDFALGMLSSEQDALYEIEQALNRIRDGTYGVCELTGKRIEPARLEAIPWTRFSAAVERDLEKQGEVRRVRLGPRETVAKAESAEEEEE